MFPLSFLGQLVLVQFSLTYHDGPLIVGLVELCIMIHNVYNKWFGGYSVKIAYIEGLGAFL